MAVVVVDVVAVVVVFLSFSCLFFVFVHHSVVFHLTVTNMYFFSSANTHYVTTLHYSRERHGQSGGDARALLLLSEPYRIAPAFYVPAGARCCGSQLGGVQVVVVSRTRQTVDYWADLAARTRSRRG